MAGCKGLVIVDPTSTLEQFYIKIRPSMKKFECDQWDLEICEASRASLFHSLVFIILHTSSPIVPTRLNNQIIMLMSDLGISDSIFLDLQEKWFTNPTNTLFNSM